MIDPRRPTDEKNSLSGRVQKMKNPKNLLNEDEDTQVEGTRPPLHNAPQWLSGCSSAARRKSGTDGRAGRGTAPGSHEPLK